MRPLYNTMFDVAFSLEHFYEDPDKIPNGHILKALKDRVEMFEKYPSEMECAFGELDTFEVTSPRPAMSEDNLLVSVIYRIAEEYLSREFTPVGKPFHTPGEWLKKNSRGELYPCVRLVVQCGGDEVDPFFAPHNAACMCYQRMASRLTDYGYRLGALSKEIAVIIKD